jgi:hypothetical protein
LCLIKTSAHCERHFAMIFIYFSTVFTRHFVVTLKLKRNFIIHFKQHDFEDMINLILKSMLPTFELVMSESMKQSHYFST